MAVVEYFFTLVSPWTFLGDAAFRGIAQKHGATIRHVPVNMGRVFQATGGLPLAKRSDARKALRMQELKRWRAYRDVPINLEPAQWIEERDISDTETAIAITNACDLDGKLLSAAASNPSVNAIWERNTDDAIARGVMGAPFYIIDEHTLWGQDRLEFVENILTKR
jgi:2-hydroxychromene-2-carboxylate isomerase